MTFAFLFAHGTFRTKLTPPEASRGHSGSGITDLGSPNHICYGIEHVPRASRNRIERICDATEPLLLDLPHGDGGERAHGDVLGGVPEVAAHVDPGHDPGEGGEEHSEHAEPVVVLGVVRLAVRLPHAHVPPHEAVFF